MDDPVCEMVVTASSAAASVVRGGRTYYFCSQGCQEAFLRDPGGRP